MYKADFQLVVDFVRSLYASDNFIPLHVPVFKGNERKYVLDTIDSTFVSSVGAYVNKFENLMCEITGAKYAVAIVSGTNALHLSLILAGVEQEDEVITQSLTFIATCNAISYLKARPVFVDIDRDTLGLSPDALEQFLSSSTEVRNDGFCYNKISGRRIKACVPMHTFGFPCRIDKIVEVCKRYNIFLVEDAAESIGSYYKEKHTGTYGSIGVFSFNGNKTVTCGGGGAIITNDNEIAKKAKHLSTQAKVSHRWDFYHDEVGYNYRMPNINAALACAQLEQLDLFIESKRDIASLYSSFFDHTNIEYIKEPDNTKANYWLNAILLKDRFERDLFLEFTNDQGVMTRPSWELMHHLPMYKDSQHGDLTVSEWIAERLVNIPSSVKL
ncbi:aminotransferase, LLPSF_NHT_00031 family [Daejeonella rubra]|uniref:GDP-perosamine synthase n=1 Tax=Daejeonella rubra TaxID=990371 RepID=A0A1G9WTM5_9SPHI|nr:LegC family aminotransferase [Daejeonella rubra]SDM87747.1 aminotransferase, LLPSF_NHT_00031 family [Daejeonella rubra]